MTEFIKKFPQPGFHPNLIAVRCRNQDDMRVLAGIMREAAIKDCAPAGSEYAASDTLDEAEEKAEVVVPDMLELGLLRFIQYEKNLPVNVVFTLREDAPGSGREWNLSISHGTRNGPERVADDLAKMIVEAFLEDDYQEVEPKAIWKTVRHFIKKAT